MRPLFLAALLAIFPFAGFAAGPQWRCEWEDGGSDAGSMVLPDRHPLAYYSHTIPPLFPALKSMVEQHPDFTARHRLVGIVDGKRIYDTFISFDRFFAVKLILIERAKDTYSPILVFLTMPGQWPLSRSFLVMRDGRSYLVHYVWENARIPGPYVRCWRMIDGQPQLVPAGKVISNDTIPHEIESP